MLSNYDNFPQTIPFIVEDEVFLYPFMITPLFLTNEENIKAVENAIEFNRLIMVTVSKSGKEQKREQDSFYDIGVVGNVMRKVSLPDGKVKVLFQGVAKAKIVDFVPSNNLFATVELVQDSYESELELKSLINILLDNVKKLSRLNNKFPADLIKAIEENEDASRVADLISSVLKLKKDEAYKIYSQTSIEQRLIDIIEYVKNEIESYKIQKEITQKVNSKIEKTHKDYFLKEQIKAIQKELGTDSQKEEELKSFKKILKSKRAFMGKEAYKETKKQLDKLSRMNQDSPDASLLQTYVEMVLDIPFGEYSNSKISIASVEKQLNKDHFSLEKAKERITEYFAVKQLLEQRKLEDMQSKGTVLCFVGPPGVGKTSLANSISKALDRPLVRVALGGMEDVNELRGHRRTYVGAMPGRLIKGLIDAKKMNPVVVLDEIDKLGANHRGDPSAVMLEILDPEQNHEFRDLYLNFPVDLSQVIFVSTANDIRRIPAPLRDRMEFIEINSYTPNEKYHIAKDYLIPQELEKHGLKKDEVNLSKATIELIIAKYTREAGVRNLRRVFSKIFRKVVKKLLQDESLEKITIGTKDLKEYLDNPIFEIELADKVDMVGVSNGLAWTAVGGDILKIEAIKLKGKGGLKVTGNLGEVMKESSTISYSVIKHLIDNNILKIDENLIPKTFKEQEENTKLEISEIYKRYDIHLHIPEGATPKDGPSAGITMALAIASILSNRKIKADVAMTGELTLSGKVLPIGGLKEKLIAAYKAKIKKALIPKKNFERDLDELPEEVKNAIEIKVVNTIEDVLKEALV
ncbi:endopeptidase La [Arcobacter porcinus]|uniref:Lon protease n=1 Tax=Arcobacter porcinus TaxID=1935204 RepID=A0A5C2HD71_9BACT|nr:endopeptidase La [Arcobacter porcinus]OCL89672.1 Lon protease [Aliarcobacter thereius]OCL81851.1 Lon protease [Arcobacter porcinus]OCL83969.1 Lon protease [Arcobacter porcinus]OCL87160.1 Lon protease [Arcobacter porcinus]QEP40124.1 DNA-binding, ATP-dependent protease La [Arcobacter porcinus]